MSKKNTTEQFIKMVHPKFGFDPNYYICIFSISKYTKTKNETLDNGQVIKRKYNPTKNAFFNDMDKFCDYVDKMKNSNNLYYSVAEVDGNGRKDENIVSASSIILDIDFHNSNAKKPSAQEISKRIRSKIKIYITSIVDTGHGFQIIIPIERTTDIKRWTKVTKKLVNLLNADANAAKTTQVMRLPNTYNFKDPKKGIPVNAVYINKGPVYTLDKLEKMINNTDLSSFSTTTSNMKPCIENMLKGVPQGHRNFCLGRITAELIRLKYSYEDAKKVVLEFNEKCKPAKHIIIVTNDFNAYWNGIDNKGYNLRGCEVKDEFGNIIKSQNDILQAYCDEDGCIRNDKTMSFENDSKNAISIPSLLCNPFTIKDLSGNELALLIEIYIKNGLSAKDINNNYSLSRPTIKKCINTLLNLDLITNENKVYRLKSNSKDMIKINPYICKQILNKKVASSLLPIYLTICYLNKVKDYPSIIKISQLLQIDKGNVSKAVYTLSEIGYVQKNMKAIGAGVVYHLLAS